MIKQYIVIRKDLPMSPGKLAAQTSHASLAFLTNMMASNIKRIDDTYECNISIDKYLWENWMSPDASFTKVTLGIKNRDKMIKLIEKAKSFGFEEGKDFFCIHDAAKTELSDFIEEDGSVLTCVGFKPREESELRELLKRLQLFK